MHGTPMRECVHPAVNSLASKAMTPPAPEHLPLLCRPVRFQCGVRSCGRHAAAVVQDATSSIDVLRALSRLSGCGMNVVTVIHQPRYSLYELFDSLLLLGVGGVTVYNGPPLLTEAYFGMHGFAMRPHDNVADFNLDVVSGRVSKAGDPLFAKESLPCASLLCNVVGAPEWPAASTWPKAIKHARAVALGGGVSRLAPLGRLRESVPSKTEQRDQCSCTARRDPRLGGFLLCMQACWWHTQRVHGQDTSFCEVQGKRSRPCRALWEVHGQEFLNAHGASNSTAWRESFRLPPEVRRKLGSEFAAADKDDSGTLDAAELSALFSKLGIVVPPAVCSHSHPPLQSEG